MVVVNDTAESADSVEAADDNVGTGAIRSGLPATNVAAAGEELLLLPLPSEH